LQCRQVQMVSLHLYMRLIETGRWLGLVPASAVRFGAKGMRIKMLPVKTQQPPAPVGVITVKDRTLTPLAQRFIDCARAVACRIAAAQPLGGHSFRS
jgi:DNA-binding transcriptional LysR family regulator